MKQSRLIASCGMTAALCVVIMFLGGVLGLGMYVSPMIAGITLMPVGRRYGRKYHLLLWAAVSILCFVLVPNAEENLMFLAVFGVYPILYPYFQKLKGILRWICKLAYFNLVIIAVEALVVMVLVPEVLSGGMIALLLVLGNVTFVLYDRLLPRMEYLMIQRLSGLKNLR